MAPGSTRKDRKKARQEKETQLCIRFSHSQLCQFCSWVCTICRYFLFDFRRRRVSWWRWSKASELCCALASSSVSFSIPLSNVVASYNIAFSLGSPIVFVGVPRKGLAPFVNNSNQTGNTVILGFFFIFTFFHFPPPKLDCCNQYLGNCLSSSSRYLSHLCSNSSNKSTTKLERIKGLF